MNDLAKFQEQIKAPKGQYNNFGKYHYRSCEDIMEAAKPIVNAAGYSLTCEDSVEEVGGRIYVKATAMLQNGEQSFSCSAYAREPESRKGMDDSQITGSASSYARKYALAGLFALDDTKDADATNNHAEVVKKAQKPSNEVVKKELTPDHGAWAKICERIKADGWDAVYPKLLQHYNISEATQAALKLETS